MTPDPVPAGIEGPGHPVDIPLTVWSQPGDRPAHPIAGPPGPRPGVPAPPAPRLTRPAWMGPLDATSMQDVHILGGREARRSSARPSKDKENPCHARHRGDVRQPQPAHAAALRRHLGRRPELRAPGRDGRHLRQLLRRIDALHARPPRDCTPAGTTSCTAAGARWSRSTTRCPSCCEQAGVHTHLATDHQHYWEDGGATYHTRYTTWEFFRGQEGDPWKGQVGRRPRTPVGAGQLRARPVRRQDRSTAAYMRDRGRPLPDPDLRRRHGVHRDERARPTAGSCRSRRSTRTSRSSPTRSTRSSTRTTTTARTSTGPTTSKVTEPRGPGRRTPATSTPRC